MNLKKKFNKFNYLRSKIYFIPRTLKESEGLNKDVKYLAIIGLPRTGTSLLQQLLNSYKDIFVSYESIYYPLFSIKDKRIRHAFYYELVKQHVHMQKEVIGFDESGLCNCKEFTFIDKYSYFGDKMIYDDSFSFQRRLRSAFGSIDKVIYIIRDPRARYASYKKWIDKRNKKFTHTGKVLKEGLLSEISKWNSFYKLVNKHSKKYRNCLFVRYEDLVQNPVEEVHRILSFLGLSFDKDKNSYLDNMTFSDSINRYLSELSNEEIGEINRNTTSGRSVFGYED